MIMMANDIRGWLGPKSYGCGKTPEKPQPGKMTRPGIEPGSVRLEATMLPFDHGGGQMCSRRFHSVYLS